MIELDPDSHVPEHQHENEQLGICLGGSLRFRVGDERSTYARGIPGRFRATFLTRCTWVPKVPSCIDVFNPPREEWREAERVEQRPTRWP